MFIAITKFSQVDLAIFNKIFVFKKDFVTTSPMFFKIQCMLF